MLSPEDTSIQQALTKAKLEINKMKMGGKQFKGMFDKSPLYEDKKPEPTEASNPTEPPAE
jgi:hypothetical protein